ncbi:MAG: type IV pilin-like G/H family protein [Cyanobacteria bacterium P01_B01_bin.77]
MKTTLRAKLLQHLASKKKANAGFTLIELLVVIIIIGILAAIALPSFLNQANRAKQSEAETYIGTTNRTQQAYRLENRQFSDDFAKLGAGIKTETNNYLYGDTNGGGGAGAAPANVGQTTGLTGSAGLAEGVEYFAVSQDPAALKDYGGAAYIVAETTTGDATATAVLCEETSVATGLLGQAISFGSSNVGTSTAQVTGTNCEIE